MGTPPSIVGIASGQPAAMPAATSHRARMLQLAPHAPGQTGRRPLGHLGHLGHLGRGFKLHGHACHWVIWVIVFA